MSLPGNDLLVQLEHENPKLGMYLRQYLAPAIQQTASNAAVGPSGNIPAPAPPQAVNVTTAGELMQITVTHNSPIQKGIQYISHIATNPQFSNAMILDHGASRCPPHINLPTKTGAGVTHNYYVATIAQYPGSTPSAPTYYGGASPVAVQMGGSTELDIQPGTGSGTASNGGQAFVGLGKSQVRLK
jgi:hypothetical protein